LRSKILTIDFEKNTNLLSGTGLGGSEST